VTALIDNVNQDPHSFEASARDQLAVQDADIVIMNGGGYDDFVEQMVEADETPAILINAYNASGDDDTRNEHIWYSASQVKDVGNVIFSALETVDRNSTSIYESNLAEFEAQIKLIEIRTAQITETWGGAKVFATEPLIYYLLQDTGMVDITPAEFSEAIEEERDVAPAVMLEAQDAVKQAKFIAVNSSTRTAQIDQVLSDASATAFGFGELLPQDPDTGEYQGDYFEMMTSALDMIVEGARP
jgi:zinc/manganese transport system substrate-binding protein